MDPILEVRDLVKHFGKVKAVDGISIAIKPGTCFGLLGPNGAGKTTTVELIEGIIAPTSGEIFYKGGPIGDQFKQEVGIQFQTTTIQDFLKVREALTLFSKFYDNPLPLEKIVEICHLGELMERDTRKLSGGQRQRLLLGLALVNNPSILFLDEPTTGLDPQARRNFWDLIREIKSQNKTVILTTHYMEEAYLLCDEIVIMDRGHLIAQGAPDHLLKERFEGAYIQIPVAQFPKKLENIPWATSEKDGYVEIQTKEIEHTMKYLIENEVSLAGLKVRSSTLEDLFLDLTGRNLRA